ncbi:MAG: hypothetical protein EX285_00025 [Thaumarchaeota archaeon]|nr:hypothetical protein [Nitrososphaerota archaeon]
MFIPEKLGINTLSLYNEDLINKLQTEFRNWKIGWVEKHYSSGDEFDEESYIEKHHECFFVDLKTIYKTNLVILDHSSSILRMEQEHKRTIARAKHWIIWVLSSLCLPLTLKKTRLSVG